MIPMLDRQYGHAVQMPMVLCWVYVATTLYWTLDVVVLLVVSHLYWPVGH